MNPLVIPATVRAGARVSRSVEVPGAVMQTDGRVLVRISGLYG